MTARNEHDLYERFKLELEELRTHPPIEILLEAEVAWFIMAQLQLALRHPGNTGPTSAIAHRLTNMLARELAPEGTARREVYEQGWQMEYDLPVWDGGALEDMEEDA